MADMMLGPRSEAAAFGDAGDRVEAMLDQWQEAADGAGLETSAC
jgi:hypothetical protein